MKRLITSLVLVFIAAGGAAQTDAPENPPDWSGSIVQIEVSRLQYTHYQPWTSSIGSTRKTGVAVGGERILTTADWMQDSTLVRVQKGGRGRWWNAKIEWIDYHSNLAVLRVDDPEFWKGMKPAPLADKAPTKGEVQIWRFSDGNLQAWKGTVSKVFVQKSQRSFVRYLTMEITSDINASGWSEVVVRAGKLAGLVASQDGNRLLAVPAPLIRNLLNARKSKGASAGLGHFDFGWQYAKNPATTAFLGLEGDPRGIIVTSVTKTSPFSSVLQSRDVILEIDGFPIDANGDYNDPDYGYLSFYNLATRNKLAGDEVKFKLWRNRKALDMSLKLPKADYDSELVPDWNFDEPPEYMIVGGLVLQPLTTSYLQSWGGKWWEAAPFRLNYYTFQDPTPDRPHLVFLSLVLPDSFNLGYQDHAYLVVDRINGKRIVNLSDVEEALRHPQERFHVIEFVPNKELQKMVLDAAELDAATARILEKYGIPRASVIHGQKGREKAPALPVPAKT